MKRAVFLILVIIVTVFAQNEDAYTTNEKNEHSGALDPSRLTINHSMSFGMASGTATGGVKSQSLYSTMMQYKFTAPITLNLNFSLPIHSTFSNASNLNSENLQSQEYFNNIPVDVSLQWKPSDNFLMKFSLVRNTPGSYYSNFFGNYDLFGEPLEK